MGTTARATGPVDAASVCPCPHRTFDLVFLFIRPDFTSNQAEVAIAFFNLQLWMGYGSLFFDNLSGEIVVTPHKSSTLELLNFLSRISVIACGQISEILESSYSFPDKHLHHLRTRKSRQISRKSEDSPKCDWGRSPPAHGQQRTMNYE